MLKRSDLINIKNEFENKIDRNKFDTSIIKDGLEKLLFNLNSSNCESDSRFVPYGRMLFLQEELNKNLDENNFIDSYFDISDYLSETRNSANVNPEIIDKNIEYYNDDIICSEEKKILIEMINKYLIAINKKEEMNYMNNEEKKAIAKEFYDKLGLTNYTLEVERDNEINADFVWVPDTRGPGGLIIGDNGDYLFCQSMHDFNYWKEEYKKGVRTSGGNDDSLKLSNGKYAEDVETKEAFDNYMNKVNRYNEQVANGKMPDINMGDILNEYENKFYDEELENKIRKIKNDWDNKPKDDNLDKIISDVDKKIDELDNKDDNNHFYKNKEEDTIWWVENPDKVGEHLFSFDKERIFNLFRDYPNELTPEQKEIFDKENPYWADFFKDKKE